MADDFDALLQRHRDAYRAKVRSEIEQRLASERHNIEAQELARALNGAGIQQPLHLTDPTRRNVTRKLRYPRGCLIRVNHQFVGFAATPGSQLDQLHKAVIQHIGSAEVSRVQLCRDLETLGLGERHANITSELTILLDRGALLARDPRKPHVVGDAY